MSLTKFCNEEIQTPTNKQNHLTCIFCCQYQVKGLRKMNADFQLQNVTFFAFFPGVLPPSYPEFKMSVVMDSNPVLVGVVSQVMDKRLTPSRWTTPMDYPNGLPKWTTLKWTTPKKSYFATRELPGTNNIKNILCYPYNIKS